MAVVLLGVLGNATDKKHDNASRDQAAPSPVVASSPMSSTPPSTQSSATTTRPTSSAPSAVAVDHSQAFGQLATAVLATLLVKGRAPMTGYDRAQFGTAWTDDNDDPLGHNGCDTRNDILGRDLTGDTYESGTGGCEVLTGTLHDPYTGGVIAFQRGPESTKVQIDHVVALGDAYQTGAQYESAQDRTDLANDPLELLAVDGSTNESKGDGDAASWLPPNKAYRCAYVARQIAVKARYKLWMTSAEHDASFRVLASCPGQRVPTEKTKPVVRHAPTPAPAPTRHQHRHTTSPTTAAPAGGCTLTSTGKCIRRGEYCSSGLEGQTGTDAGGNTLTCTGAGRLRWE